MNILTKTSPPSYNKKAVSFGTIERVVYKDSNKKDILYMNNTSLFRNDIYWEMMIDYIVNNGNIKKIYCYACSDGSEPYSIAIALISKLGYKNAKKFFPIIARDIDLYVLNRANTGNITLRNNDLKKLKKYTKKAGIKFIEEKPFSKSDNENNYKVTKELRECVDFKPGNFVHDSEINNFKNSAVFFRNVWPYLSAGNLNFLLKNLEENIDESALLIVGEYDKGKLALDNDDKFYFDNLLYNNGFIEHRPLIYKKSPSENKSKVIKNELAYIKTYCLCELYKNYYYYKRLFTGNFKNF